MEKCFLVSTDPGLILIEHDPVFGIRPIGDTALAFDQIRPSAFGNVAIMVGMPNAINTIASQAASPWRRRALDEQVQWISELADRTIESTHDRARRERRLMHVRESRKGEAALSSAKEA
jgi:uncharacterized membrane protein